MEHTVRTTPSGLLELLDHLYRQAIEIRDYPALIAIVLKEVGRVTRRQERAAGKAAAESAPEEEKTDNDDDVSDSSTDAHASGEVTSAQTGGAAKPGADRRRKGHGRNGAGAYVNATEHFHRLAPGVVGGPCPGCGIGPMVRYRVKLVVAIKGQPPFPCEKHHFEQARCKLCGFIVQAEGLELVTAGIGSSYINYDASACAMLIVLHYFVGMPFNRLDSLQAGWGIPMSDANQWAVVDAASDRLVPLHRALERHGVHNALTLRIDDTGSMIIDVRQAIREEIAALEADGKSTKDVRTGINATGVYIDTEDGKVLLYYTGRHHAGEIIDRLLAHRTAAEQSRRKIVKVSDAASKNFSHDHKDDFEEAACNAHAFLKFHGIKDQHPREYALAAEVYKNVFANDDATREAGMSPLQRMRYHQKHSLPEMKRLKEMCRDNLVNKLAEPNAPLWEPVNFIINQWSRLIRFCEVPGVPLDSNAVEQMLIIAVRYLGASFNYRTQNGAVVGDICMSLVASANANGLEPVAYLTECLENHEDLAARPEYYLPWVYRARLEARDKATQTSPISAPGIRAKAVEHALRPGTLRRPTMPDQTRGPPQVAPP